jgi:hypothetical protein
MSRIGRCRIAVNGQMGPGAFLIAPGGLYDGPEAAKVAATIEAVKRRGLDIKAEL